MSAARHRGRHTGRGRSGDNGLAATAVLVVIIVLGLLAVSCGAALALKVLSAWAG